MTKIVRKSIGYGCKMTIGIYIPCLVFIAVLSAIQIAVSKTNSLQTPTPTPTSIPPSSPSPTFSLTEQTQLADKIKGDLIGQILYPVIIAIASIFGAFALKDGVAEFLKEKDRENFKKELETKLEIGKIREYIRELQNFQLLCENSLRAMDGYSMWTEYQNLQDESINLIHNRLPSSSPALDKDILLTFKKTLERSKKTLNLVSREFRDSDFGIILDSSRGILKSKVRENITNLAYQEKFVYQIDKLLQVDSAFHNGDELLLEERRERIDNIFQIQLRLLELDLRNLPSDPSIDSLINRVHQRLNEDPQVIYEQKSDSNDFHMKQIEYKPEQI